MRRLLFAALTIALLLPNRASAQKAYAVDAGSMIADGSAGFSSSGGDLYQRRGNGEDIGRRTSISISPSIAYFAAPHLALGGTISYNRTSQDETSQTFFGIGPTVAWFFGNAGSRTFPFVRASYLYGRSRFDDDFSVSQNNFKFSAGAAFMLAKNVALTSNAFYTIENLKNESTSFGSSGSTDGNIFGVEFGIAAFVF